MVEVELEEMVMVGKQMELAQGNRMVLLGKAMAGVRRLAAAMELVLAEGKVPLLGKVQEQAMAVAEELGLRRAMEMPLGMDMGLAEKINIK